MDSDLILKFNFQKDEVVSAQQLEMLQSNRAKFMFAVAILGLLGLLVPQIRFWIEDNTISTIWWVPLWFLLAYGAGFSYTYCYKPLNDFRINPFWRNRFELQLSSEQFRLLPERASTRFEVPWNKIKRVLENDKVFVLFWESDKAYMILPKRVLQSQEKYLREHLSHVAKREWKVKK
jgi:hypothetical protein